MARVDKAPFTGPGPPGDSPLTSWNDTALFDGYNYTGYAVWGEVVGRLALLYPHLVSLDIVSLAPRRSLNALLSRAVQNLAK
eukprot:COSAG02_NODE_179_length_31090_cov_49.813785_22_plen_82_part_00